MTRRSTSLVVVLLVAVGADGRAAPRPGQLLLTDRANGRVLVVDPESGAVSTLTPRVGQADALGEPTGIAISRATGELYVLDAEDGDLVEIDPATGAQEPVLGPGDTPLHVEGPRALEIPPLEEGAAGDRLLITATSGIHEVQRTPDGFVATLLSSDPALPDDPTGSALERFAEGESFWLAGGDEGALHVARPPFGSFSFDPVGGLEPGEIVADVDRAPSARQSVLAVFEPTEGGGCTGGRLLDLELAPLPPVSLRCPLAAAVGLRGEIYVADAATRDGGSVVIVKVEDDEAIVAAVPDGPLPTLPGDLELVPGRSTFEVFRGGPQDSIEVQGVSADGTAIVGSRFDDVSQIAVRIDGNGSLLDLVEGFAAAASRDGSVVVGRDVDGLAFRWTEATGALPLELPDGFTLSSARALSDDGQVVGGFASADSARVAVRWDLGQGGVPELLDYLDEGDTRATVAAGTADGSILVGQSGTDSSSGGSRAVRWGPDGGAEDLGTIPGGPIEAFVTDISDDGRVVVGYGTSTLQHLAFRWTEAQGMVALDALNSAFQSEASAVSGDGRLVVGQFYNGPSPNFTFLWDPEHGVRDFWVELVDVHGLDLADRTLGVVDVSSDGRTFVGGLYDEEQDRSAALRVRLVPEPGAGGSGVAAIALLTVLARARRRSIRGLWIRRRG